MTLSEDYNGLVASGGKPKSSWTPAQVQNTVGPDSELSPKEVDFTDLSATHLLLHRNPQTGADPRSADWSNLKIECVEEEIEGDFKRGGDRTIAGETARGAQAEKTQLRISVGAGAPTQNEFRGISAAVSFLYFGVQVQVYEWTRSGSNRGNLADVESLHFSRSATHNQTGIALRKVSCWDRGCSAPEISLPDFVPLPTSPIFLAYFTYIRLVSAQLLT
ncbi:hypothetical protein B0H14DRAFT_2637101 [Mycena olivaceomarginata]|nr:hypothetical protein B0H14DRAFT_2637101 [Mycena olivaceomarginata]